MRRIFEFLKDIRNLLLHTGEKEFKAFGCNMWGPGLMVVNYSQSDLEKLYSNLENEVQFIKKIKNKSDINVIDIGANLGLYSIAYGLQPNVRVMSFEPCSQSFSFLSRNIRENKVSSVIAHPVVLYEDDVDLPIGVPLSFYNYSILTRILKFTDKRMSGCLSIYTQDPNAKIERFVAGDKFQAITDLSQLDLIKIDVEGAELPVLRGLSKTILVNKPLIRIELNSHSLQTADSSQSEIVGFLKDSGYTRYSVCPINRNIDEWDAIDNFKPFSNSPDVMFWG